MVLGSMAIVIKGDISDFNKNISSLQKQLNSSTKGLQTVSKSMTSVGDSMTKGVTVPLIAVGAILLKVGKDFDDAYDKIRIGTGKTGKELENLQGDFKAVAKDSASSFGDISTTIAELNKRLGLTGKPLQDLSTQMLNFARITNSDINTLVPATTRVFGDWSIATKDQSKAMDTLFKVSQTTGISAATLAERVVELGAPLRNLGFSFTEATALMGKWEKEGVNTTTVFSGLRQALRVFAKEGVTDTKGALMDLVEQMKNASTSGEAASIGMAYFGKGLNDVVDTARGGKFDIAELVNTIEGSTDTINGAAAATDDWKEKLDKLKNEAMVNLEPIANKVFDSITRGVEKVTPKIEELTKWFGNLSDAQTDNLLKWGLIVAAIGPVLSITGRTITGVIQLRTAILTLNAAIKASAFVGIGSFGGSVAAVGISAVASAAGLFAMAQRLEDLTKVIPNTYRSANDLLITLEAIARLGLPKPLVDYFVNLTNKILGTDQATKDITVSFDDSSNSTKELTAEMFQLKAGHQGVKTATEESTAANEEETLSIDDMRGAYNELIGVLFDSINTSNAFQEADWALKDAQDAVTEAIKKYGVGSREAETAVNGLDAASQTYIDTAYGVYTAVDATKEEQEAARLKAIEYGLQMVATGKWSETAFISMASQFGMSSDQIIAYADSMGITLDEVTRARIVMISVDTGNSVQQVQDLKDLLNGVHDKTVTIETIYKQSRMLSGGFKEGGLVGFKDGGLLSASQGINLPKFDSGGVLALLHPPEVVLNKDNALNILWNMTKPQANADKAVSSGKQEILLKNVINLDGKVLWESNEKYAIRATGERV